MPAELIVLTAVIGGLAVAWVARRDAKAALAARHAILDEALSLFERPEHAIDPSGFPMIEGRLNGQPTRLALILDTMTIRRLPQLWAEMTLLRDTGLSGRSVAILVRPSGADYYSLTERMPVRFDPPGDFPNECLIKGDSVNSAATLARIAPAAGKLLKDKTIKELAVTGKGMRIVRQLGEGKRGEHLLLRQCVFEGAALQRGGVETMAAALQSLDAALTAKARAPAA